MAYSTLAQVQVAVGGPEKLLQLTDLENANAPTVDAGVVDGAIAEADGVIDSYIGHRFGIPLAAPSAMISALSATWAARVLRRNKYNGQALQDDIDREKIDREWLVGVSKGLISPGMDPLPAPASFINDKAGQRVSTMTISRLRGRGVMW